MSDASDTKNVAATSIPIKLLLFTLLRLWTCLPLNGLLISNLPQHQPIGTKFSHSRIFNLKITPKLFLLFLLLQVRFQSFLANFVFSIVAVIHFSLRNYFLPPLDTIKNWFIFLLQPQHFKEVSVNIRKTFCCLQIHPEPHKISKSTKIWEVITQERVSLSTTQLVSCNFSSTSTTAIYYIHELLPPSTSSSLFFCHQALSHCRTPSMLRSGLLIQMTTSIFNWIMKKSFWATFHPSLTFPIILFCTSIFLLYHW